MKTVGPHTERCEDELIKRNTLHDWKRWIQLSERESPGQEAKPLKLQWGHEETVRHEPSQTLKVEWWQASRMAQLSSTCGLPFVPVVDLDRDEIIATLRSSSERCNQLCDGIGHST